jgi:hypothetical protein
MNGDRLAYELEHANTPLRERSDWPLPSFDARDWAEAFCKVCTEKGFDPVKDEDWVMGWFANALMRGYDQGRAENEVLP